MLLAELEVYHSRPVAPTRRVALGKMTLPADPPPGFGGVLLGGIVANNIRRIDADLVPELQRLIFALDAGQRISQPRLSFRLQRDKVGLQRSRHRLVGDGDSLSFEFDDGNGEPSQQLLGAVYAAGQLPPRIRSAIMGTLRGAIAWQGDLGPDLITALAGFSAARDWSAMAISHPIEWALDVLGFNGVDVRGLDGSRGGGASSRASCGTPSAQRDPAGRTSTEEPFDLEDDSGGHLDDTATGVGPSRGEIQRAYRQLLIEAHPDHGGHVDDAAQRIAELGEARRILLG